MDSHVKLTAPAKLPNNRNYGTQPPSSGRLQRLSCYNFINRSSSDLKAYCVVMCQQKSNAWSPTEIKELQMW